MRSVTIAAANHTFAKTVTAKTQATETFLKVVFGAEFAKLCHMFLPMHQVSYIMLKTSWRETYKL